MSNADAVAQLTLDSFGFGRIGSVRAVSLATAGNAVITIPILSGGLTNSGAAAGSGSVIVRRVTVKNATGNVATANVAISVASDGNIAAANAVVANVVLSNLTGVGKYQDLTVAGAYGANTAITGFATQCLYVNINTANANGTVDISVFGEVVSF
jgi:hypothetical protein